MQRMTLGALDRKEAKGRLATEEWRAHTREVEIKEPELPLLQEHVGTSPAAQVRHSSSHCPLGLPLMKGPPPVLDRHATSGAQVVHRRHGHCGQGCAREAHSGRGGDQ